MNQLDIQVVCEAQKLPEPGQLQRWVDVALGDYQASSEVVIRIVDEAESAALNEQYRHKQGSTNILSFPFEAPPGVEMDLLGDLVVCAPVVAREALQQHKALFDHWAHIIVHGVLHLLGYDHIEEDEAEEMEALEIKILHYLNIQNPYLEDNNS